MLNGSTYLSDWKVHLERIGQTRGARANAVFEISRDGSHSVIRMRTEQNQKWYPSQKKWYFSHFAKTQKEIHTLSPEPDGAHPRGAAGST